MHEYLVTGETLPEAYHQALRTLQQHGEELSCDDWGTRQRELSMTMQVLQPLKEPMISRLFIGDPRSLEQYRQEMLDGILDFEVERGNWHYTYHQRMASQLGFITDELRRSADSRRAVVDIRAAEDVGSESPACLQHLQYFIRNGALHCKVLFRSNDAAKATFMNAFALILLQQRIADELGVPVGSYTHRANSFHCYARDFGLLEGYVRRLSDGGEVTYDYEEDWRELMESYRDEIARDVERLRG